MLDGFDIATEAWNAIKSAVDAFNLSNGGVLELHYPREIQIDDDVYCAWEFED